MLRFGDAAVFYVVQGDIDFNADTIGFHSCLSDMFRHLPMRGFCGVRLWTGERSIVWEVASRQVATESFRDSVRGDSDINIHINTVIFNVHRLLSRI